MTTIEDVLTYIDGSNANGRLVVAWKPFTVGNVNAAGGELEWPIVDGAVSISLYANTGALPTGSYYVAKYELENGAVYLEQWVVPNLPTVNLGQVRVSFPPSPSVMISPLQLTSLGATPGMFLMWDGQRWVPGYPSTFNLDPNWIGVAVGSSGNDISVTNPQVHLGNSFTINIPDAGPASRGVVTTSPQSFGGVKTFLNTVQISTSIQFALRAISPVYGELLGFGTGGADSSLAFGGNIYASRVSPVDRPYMRADHFIGSNLDLETFGDPPTAVMPGSLANPARNLAALLLPVAGTVDWTGIGTDTAGALWLRTGTSTAAGFLYLDTAGNVTAREFRMDPYQHLNAPGVEAARSDATMVMYSGASDWAGYGVNSTPEIWFRMGPNAAGAYYYFGAGGARFPGNLTVGNIIVTGGVTLPAGTYVPTSRKINTPALGGLTGGGDLTIDRTLTVVDNTTTQRVEAAQGGILKATHKRLNFIAGAGQLITVVDDSANDQANVTITSSTSGSASPSIYSVNGTPIGTQPELNLVAGTNVILNGANNSGLNRVDITVTTAGGAAITDPTTAVGDLIVRGTVTPSPLTRLAAGTTTGYVLTTDLSTAPFIKWADRVPITRQIIAGAGLGGGGALGGIAATDVTLTANVLSVNGQTGAVTLTVANVGGVPTTRQIIAGTGLSGGGPLSADVTLAVVNDTVTERVRVSNAGTLVGTRQQINFIQGANITLTVADVPGSNWVGVTVAASTSGLTDPTTTKGDLIVRPVGPPATRMGVGTTDGMVLTVDSTDATFGIKWKVVPASPQTPWASDIDGAGKTLFNAGKVGIGRIPEVALDVVGSGLFRPIVQQNPTSGQALRVGYESAGSVGDIICYDWTASAIRPLQIRGNPTYFLGGNVGVGTGSPNSSLLQIGVGSTVVPGIADVYGLDRSLASGTALVNILTTDAIGLDKGGSLALGGTGSAQPYGFAYLAGRSENNFNAGYFQISTVTAAGIVTERMRITAGGNVGIGTTGPNERLSMSGGNMLLDAFGDAGTTQNLAQHGIFFRAAFSPLGGNGGTEGARRNVSITTGNGTSGLGDALDINASHHISFFTSGASERMRIDGGGNVGIGTTSPQARLNVAAVSTDPSLSADTEGIYFGYSSSIGLAFGSYASGSFAAWIQTKRTTNSGTADRLALNPLGGNVGIWTASPGAQLSTGSNLAPVKIATWDSGDGASAYGIGVASGLLTFGVGINPTSGTPQMTLSNTQLSVVGDVNCSGVFRVNGAAIGQISTRGVSGASLNTVYQNGTGKPMFISVTVSVVAGQYIQFLTDAGNPPTVIVSAATNATVGTSETISVCGWVMPGHYHKIVNSSGSSSLVTWIEWY